MCSFLFKNFYLFQLEANYFTILWWVLPYIDIDQPWVYPPCVPHSEPHSHLPPCPFPLGCPSAPALGALFHASTLDWWSSSHMAIYMFQCCSLKSSHPLLLPESKSLFFTSAFPFWTCFLVVSFFRIWHVPQGWDPWHIKTMSVPLFVVLVRNLHFLLFSVLGYCCCWNKSTPSDWCKTRQAYYLIALEIRSESYGTKIKLRQQGCVPYGGSRKESVPCLFQLLEATCVAWLVASSL